MPCRSGESCAAFSSTVTPTPRAARSRASDVPATPPPMTIADLGIATGASFRLKANLAPAPANKSSAARRHEH